MYPTHTSAWPICHHRASVPVATTADCHIITDGSIERSGSTSTLCGEVHAITSLIVPYLASNSIPRRSKWTVITPTTTTKVSVALNLTYQGMHTGAAVCMQDAPVVARSGSRPEICWHGNAARSTARTSPPVTGSAGNTAPGERRLSRSTTGSFPKGRVSGRHGGGGDRRVESGRVLGSASLVKSGTYVIYHHRK